MRHRHLTLIALAILVAACQPSDETVAPLYDTAEVEEQDIEVVVEAAGVIEAEATVEVKSKASGEVLAVHAETGDLVEADSLLVEIEKRTPQNRLDEVEAALIAQQARLRIAQTAMERAEKLHESKTLTQADFEQTQLEFANAQSQVVSARVAVENARITLDDTNVRAPITGTVIEKTVEPGTVISSPTQAVSDGTVLMKMADLTSVQVRARVDETDIGKVTPGMTARVVAAAYPNQPFEGQVLKIEPLAIVEQNVTMFAVLIKIPNRGGLLKPGMNADVEIQIVERDNLSVVPTAALRTESDIPLTAQMLGMKENEVRRALGLPEVPEADGNTITFNGQRIELPEGVDAKEVQDLMAKRRSGADLSQSERTLIRRVLDAAEAVGVDLRGGVSGGSQFAGRPAGGGAGAGAGAGGFGGRPNGSFPGGNERPANATAYQFGGDYWVVAVRDNAIVPLNVRTGLTDLEYSEVISGLEPTDQVLLLPTTSLYEQQAQLQEFIQRRFGGGSPFQRGR